MPSPNLDPGSVHGHLGKFVMFLTVRIGHVKLDQGDPEVIDHFVKGQTVERGASLAVDGSDVMDEEDRDKNEGET